MSNNPPQAAPLTAQFLGFGPGGPLPLSSPWILFGGYINYLGGVLIGNPIGGNLGNGILNTQDLYVNGVKFEPQLYLSLSGGIITGNLNISGNFGVIGSSTFSTLSTSGLATLNSLTVTGAATFNGGISGTATSVRIDAGSF